MKIALASDHGGFRYKERIKQHLIARGFEVVDCGAHIEEPADDYPPLIIPAAEAVARKECALGVIFGGSGNGEAIVANKIKGIRCAVCWNDQTARWARVDNHANMISIGQRVVAEELITRIVDAWLDSAPDQGRHLRRVEQIKALEEKVYAN